MRTSAAVTVAALLLLTACASAAPANAQHGWASPIQTRYWVGEDGAPLPFRSDDEIKEFLSTAEVVGSEDIPVGVTDPLRITLEKDGVRAHAVFRYVDKLYERERLRNGRMYINFKDSCRFEPAAYEFARLLGMDNVPPTVERRIGGRRGTLQIWVYDARTETDRIEQEVLPPSGLQWARQMHQMILFDVLIGNEDRNTGNILIDGDWKVWLIDHTRAFYARAESRGLDGIAFVDAGFWMRLQVVDEAMLEFALGDYVSNDQIDRILERRDRIVARVDELIAERGADIVLYD